MDYILQGLYGYCDTFICWILGLGFFLHIISLRKWFDNRAKNETLLEIIWSLHTNNEQLADRINTIKNQKLPEKN